MSPKPRTRRAVVKSLVWDRLDDGRFIAGSKWFQIRISGDTKQEIIDCVLAMWDGSKPLPLVM